MSRQDEQFLAHYGREGMRWGMNIFGKKKNATTKDRSAPKTVAPQSKRPSEMTMEELKKINERLKAESEYRKYISELTAKKDGRVKKFVFDMMETAAKTYLESAIKKHANSIFGIDPAVTEKGKKTVEKLVNDSQKKQQNQPTKEEKAVVTEEHKENVKKGKKKVSEIFEWLDASGGF